MEAPTCIACGKRHWRNEPCRFKAAPPPPQPTSPQVCTDCERLKARIIELETEFLRPCGNEKCAERVQGAKTYCSTKCRVAANRAKKRALAQA